VIVRGSVMPRSGRRRWGSRVYFTRGFTPGYRHTSLRDFHTQRHPGSGRTRAMERVKVAILGGSGYTAVELIKILLRHPGAEIAAVTSRQDEHIADLHPALFGRLDLRCEPFDPDRLKAKGVRAAFGCLPHGTSMESIPPLLDRGIRVI